MQKKRMTGNGKLKCISNYLRKFLNNKEDAAEVVKHLYLDNTLHLLAYDLIVAANERWINTPIELRSDERNITPFAEELCGLRERYKDAQLLMSFLLRTTNTRLRYWFVDKTDFRGKPIGIKRIPDTGWEYTYDGLVIEYNERTREIKYEKISEG